MTGFTLTRIGILAVWIINSFLAYYFIRPDFPMIATSTIIIAAIIIIYIIVKIAFDMPVS